MLVAKLICAFLAVALMAGCQTPTAEPDAGTEEQPVESESDPEPETPAQTVDEAKAAQACSANDVVVPPTPGVDVNSPCYSDPMGEECREIRQDQEELRQEGLRRAGEVRAFSMESNSEVLLNAADDLYDAARDGTLFEFREAQDYFERLCRHNGF